MDGSLSASALARRDQRVRFVFLTVLLVLEVFGLCAPTDLATCLFRLLSEISWTDSSIFVSLFSQDDLVTVGVNHDGMLLLARGLCFFLKSDFLLE